MKKERTLGSYFTKKVIAILSAITVVFSIVGGIWGFESHYATKVEVSKVEKISDKNVQRLEIQVAGALQNQQYKSDARYWQFLYDKLTADIFELKRQMRRYPEDIVLQQDYRDLLERRKEVQKKLNESMEKIKVN
jgi:hypothetical protein